jgi:uncharacterized protein (DUF362 family)
VALTTGVDRADNVFRALQLFRKEIATAIGDRHIILKPNNVIGTPDNGHGNVALSDTHVACLEGILEFLKSIGKTDVTIAEACATDPTMTGFDNLGYFRLAERYPVKLVDLNQEDFEMLNIWRSNTATQSVRLSRWLLDQDHFIISAAKPKSHNNVVVTLSLKNVVMGSPLVDLGTYQGQSGARADKDRMYGNSNQCLNDNLHAVAQRIHPHLAVIDAFEGMEGEGPCWGTAVNHRVAIASLDWLAADRVGVELMGVDPSWPAYLNYCAESGLGQYDLNQIEVIGERVADHVRKYQLASNINTQLGMRAHPKA